MIFNVSRYAFGAWKYHSVTASGSTVLTTMQIPDGTVLPATLVKTHPSGAKAILNAFSLSDIALTNGNKDSSIWITHVNYLRYLFFTVLGISSPVSITGYGFVVSQMLQTTGGRSLIYLSNWNPSASDSVLITIPSLQGMTVYDMLNGGAPVSTNGGIIQVTLGADDLRMLIAEPTKKANVKILTDTTAMEIYPQLDAIPVHIRYDAGGVTQPLTLVLEYKNQFGVINTANQVVQNSGDTNLYLLLNDATYTDTNYISTDEGGRYHLRAYLVDGANVVIAETKLSVYVSLYIAPVSLPSTGVVGLPLNFTAKWNGIIPMHRLQTFPARVVIFNSTKTGSQYPRHYQQVTSMISILQSLGYQYAVIGAASERNVQLGPLYYVVTDAGGGDSLNWGFLSQFFNVLILPGVKVMTDQETSNVRSFLTNTYNTMVVATEVPGRFKSNGLSGESRLADIFGMSSSITSGATTTVTITNLKHPVTMYSNTATFTASTSEAYTTVLTPSNNLGNATIQGVRVPAIMAQPFGIGNTVLLNFGTIFSSEHVNLWRGILTHGNIWSYPGSSIQVLHWDLKCGSNVIGSSETFVARAFGSGTFSIVPTAACNQNAELVGYMYPFGSAIPWNSHYGFYTSINDAGYQLTIFGAVIPTTGTPTPTVTPTIIAETTTLALTSTSEPTTTYAVQPTTTPSPTTGIPTTTTATTTTSIPTTTVAPSTTLASVTSTIVPTTATPTTTRAATTTSAPTTTATPTIVPTTTFTPSTTLPVTTHTTTTGTPTTTFAPTTTTSTPTVASATPTITVSPTATARPTTTAIPTTAIPTTVSPLTQTPTTTKSPTPTPTFVTTTRPTTTVTPTTSTPSTTKLPTTTATPSTTKTPTTTAKPTTKPPTTTALPSTTKLLTTTIKPTTVAPTTTRAMTTTVKPTTTARVTTRSPTTTTKPTTTIRPTTTRAPTCPVATIPAATVTVGSGNCPGTPYAIDTAAPYQVTLASGYRFDYAYVKRGTICYLVTLNGNQACYYLTSPQPQQYKMFISGTSGCLGTITRVSFYATKC